MRVTGGKAIRKTFYQSLIDCRRVRVFAHIDEGPYNSDGVSIETKACPQIQTPSAITTLFEK
eukprot:m.181924 g.181924  ORF g.181924 m.181924 type:complete len:62 (+) comp32087_c0_seq5:1305-1490(+)